MMTSHPLHKRITAGNTRLKLSFLALMSLIIATEALAQSSRSSRTDDHVEQRIAGILNAFHKETGLPGATIGYVLPDGTSHSVSVGYADKDREIPMRDDHRLMAGMACGYVNVEANLFQLKQENVIRQGRFVFNPQMEWGGGGFASTPRCLARWADLLYSGEILSSAMKKEMRTTVEAKLGPGSRYGLGLMQRSSELGLVIGHSGYFPGYLTDMSYYADHDIALTLQVNTTKMSREMNPNTIKHLLDECAKAILESD